MGSSKKRQPTPPPPPDPREIAQVESEFNRLNQFTPFGNLTFQDATGGSSGFFDPWSGQFVPGTSGQRASSTLTLDPAIQNLFNLQVQSDTNLLDQALGAQQGIGGLVDNPLTTRGLPDLRFDLGQLPNIPGLQTPNVSSLQGPNLQRNVNPLDFSGAAGIPESAQQFRDDVTGAFFDRSSGLLNRQFDRQEEQLRQRLANQGLQQGGEAFSQELGDFGIQRNEAFGRLANEATLFGGQEASRALSDALRLRGTGTNEALSQFGAGLQRAGFGNQAGLQQFGVNDAVRQASIQDILRGNDISQQQFGLQQAGLQNTAQQLALQNAARATGLNEEQVLRSNQFNELASLLGLQQVGQPGLQNFFSPGQTNVLGANALQQQGLQNNFNTLANNAAGKKGGGANLLGQLGSAAIAGKN